MSGGVPAGAARDHAGPLPATRRLTLAVAALLALHVFLAWFALQAAFVFVELMWRVLAGPPELRPLLATHVDQFRVLRLLQGGLWIVTAAVFFRWLGRVRRNPLALGVTGVPYAPRQAMAALGGLWNASDPRHPAGAGWRRARPPARVLWWWALLVGAVVAEATATALALWSGRTLDLGPAMLALVLGQLLVIGAAALGIAVVLGVDGRQDAAARAPARATQDG